MITGYKVLRPFQCDPDIMVGRFSYIMLVPQEMHRHGIFYTKIEEALKDLGEFDTFWEVTVDKVSDFDPDTGIGKAKVFTLVKRWSDKDISDWFQEYAEEVMKDKDLKSVAKLRCYIPSKKDYQYSKVPEKLLQRGLYYYTGLDLTDNIEIPVSKVNPVFSFLPQMIGHMIVCQEIGLRFCNRRIYAVQINGDKLKMVGIIHFKDVLPIVYRNWNLMDKKKVQWKKTLSKSIIEDPEGEISPETLQLAKEVLAN